MLLLVLILLLLLAFHKIQRRVRVGVRERVRAKTIQNWGVVQWQDIRLWTVEPGFESLLPSIEVDSALS